MAGRGDGETSSGTGTPRRGSGAPQGYTREEPSKATLEEIEEKTTQVREEELNNRARAIAKREGENFDELSEKEQNKFRTAAEDLLMREGIREEELMSRLDGSKRVSGAPQGSVLGNDIDNRKSSELSKEPMKRSEQYMKEMMAEEASEKFAEQEQKMRQQWEDENAKSLEQYQERQYQEEIDRHAHDLADDEGKDFNNLSQKEQEKLRASAEEQMILERERTIDRLYGGN